MILIIVVVALISDCLGISNIIETKSPLLPEQKNDRLTTSSTNDNPNIWEGRSHHRPGSPNNYNPVGSNRRGGIFPFSSPSGSGSGYSGPSGPAYSDYGGGGEYSGGGGGGGFYKPSYGNSHGPTSYGHNSYGPFKPPYDGGSYEEHHYYPAEHQHEDNGNKGHFGNFKSLALKKLLIPLAGLAVLGVAAMASTNPVLLQLGTVTGRRRRSLIDTNAYPLNPKLKPDKIYSNHLIS